MTDQAGRKLAMTAANEDTDTTVLGRAAELIRVYPDGMNEQSESLIDLYPRLSHVDIAHLLSDPNLAPRFGQFVRDHRSTTSTPFSHYTFFLVFAVVGLGILIWTLTQGG